MRKELLGPLPLALGLLIVASALLSPERAPPPPCACPVHTPAAFAALDASGYPGVTSGATLVVDGRVVEIVPADPATHPYRLVRFEGSTLRFNVTNYDVFTGPVGGWTRITAVHAGQVESAGPDAGHRWSYAGRTAPPGASVVSLAAIAFGLALAAWGAASWKEFGRTRVVARSTAERIARAGAALESDPATRSATSLRDELGKAASMARRGQYGSAVSTLVGIERQVGRAATLGKRLEAARAAVAREASGGFNVGPVAAKLDEVEKSRGEGAVPEAERLLDGAQEALASLPRLRELLEVAADSIAANRAAGLEDVEADAALEGTKSLLAQGRVSDALARVTRAVDRAREVSPPAQSAASEVAALRDFLLARPEFDRTREVRDRVRDAGELYRLGQFERAQAEARVGRWLADSSMLAHEEFAQIAKAGFKARGFAIDPPAKGDPPFGFLAVKGGETALVATSAWRDFPSERLILAAKDFIREGGATSAVIYSSAFTNTSTDERIRVVDVGELVDLLRRAALAQAVAERSARGGATTSNPK